MAKQVKRVYRILAWFFSVIVAAGTLIGCGGKKYGAPEASTKYGPPAYNVPKNSLQMTSLTKKDLR